MNPSLISKLENLGEREEEINALLSDPSTFEQQDMFKKLSIELADISPVVQLYQQFREITDELEETRQMLKDDDPAIRDMAQQELPDLTERLETTELDLQKLLLPKDPNDERNIFLEIRAGTGGNEAALFSGDLFRMYTRHAEGQKWKVEVLSATEAGMGGYKEVVALIDGDSVFSRFKFEAGAHRVQRVPETESQGRIHSSACTVAVLPEADEVEIDIRPEDLEISLCRASGAGGQHVNTTDSAVRIVHKPSGIVVENFCA